MGAEGATTASPMALLMATALAIFAGEVGVMLVLPLFGRLPWGVEAVLDGLLLTLFAAPVLYLLLFRPMVLHIERRRRAETELNSLNAELEERVRARTTDLESANTSLASANRALEKANTSLERVNTALEREIRDRLAVEDRLRTTSGFLQRLVETSPCLMSVVDVSTLGCRYVNGRITDFLGYGPDEVAVSDVSFLEHIVAPDDLERVVGLVRTVAASDEDEIVRRRCHLRTKDGRATPFRLGLVPLSRPEREQASEVLFVAVPVDDGP